MCLILMAYDVHPEYRLILAANRDEFYERPTRPMGFWEEDPDLLAGRDLRSGGTWMGITASGRLAAVTNYREPAGPGPDAPSRGHLVSDFLSGTCSARSYLESVSVVGSAYSGFNLIAGDASGLHYCSNRADGVCRLDPGWYGLSNHLLNTPWPKVEKGIAMLKDAVPQNIPATVGPIFQMLKNRETPNDDRLPDTGVGLSLERVLSPLFIRSPGYGTRSSTVLLIDRSGKVTISEHTFSAGSDPGPEPVLKRSFIFWMENATPVR